MLDALFQASRNPYVILPCAIAVLSIFVAVYLAVALHRREKKAEMRLKQARADITDMTILFQTMRDIIGQQKKLARDFNEELEHKMGQVKHILNQGMDKNKQLYEKQQRIASDLEEAQARIDSLFRQLDRPATPLPPATRRPAKADDIPHPQRMQDVLPAMNTGSASQKPKTPPKPLINGSPATPAPELRRPATPPKKPTPPPTRANTGKDDPFADTGVTKSAFSSWIAEDFDGGTRKPKTKPASPDVGETAFGPEAEASPKNGEAAREAFRALLNMPPEQAAPVTPSVPDKDFGARDHESAPQETGDAPGSTQAMQQRVLEYSEAGMTVAEVSRELGIGKGEVRLMLSLAKQNYPPKA